MPNIKTTKKAKGDSTGSNLTKKQTRRKGVAAQTPRTGSKQAAVIAQLSQAEGTTIAAIVKATGWQQHSVRGFLAGVVRKKLKLKLNSEKVDGTRVYRIVGAGHAKANRGQSKSLAA